MGFNYCSSPDIIPLPEHQSAERLDCVPNLLRGMVINGITNHHQPTFPVEINPSNIDTPVVINKLKA